ncbi:transcriptional regulator [Burkholderia sp. SG-MS1]|uniref:helix-turn-helix domain-containing protein n=1 Tax=Paraburkholderia sp. SG-MS1 TaxID=2023741 RepID=UPI001447A51F|nr:helix-turn-helix transcriptional regulator [Paraburkholderia sp. SG-MS1]NKJ50490.1 transcriptional regulator [Paraburkholderia sp. SG-MS1]
MNPAKPIKKASPNDLGALLRHWRDMRGVSQLDLSFNAGVSQRHISFIESGRSVPSRQMLMDIAQALDIPLRERNTLLLAAGYAPMYADPAWNAQEMQSVTKALGRMLRQHEPFPALVMDRYWNVLMTNESAPRFFNCFIDMAARKGPRNMLHLMFDPAGLRPFVADWKSVADSLIQRVYREAVGRVIDERTRELVAALRAYPDVPEGERAECQAGAAAAMPVIPIGFVKNGHVLNYFSMVASVGTPQTVAAQELRIECMFPADDETQARHLEMLDALPLRD